MENKKATFTMMQINDILQTYLTDLNEPDEDMFLRSVKDMTKAEGITK